MNESKVVPLEPTEEIIEAFARNVLLTHNRVTREEIIAGWKAALAAAPQALEAPVGEERWLIERTYAKGQPAERREFWLGTLSGDVFSRSFDSGTGIWTTDAMQAARFLSEDIARSLVLLHFHPESTVEACGHMFQCGISPQADARMDEAVRLLRDVRGTLRTDQYDGHRRIAEKIDAFLAAVETKG